MVERDDSDWNQWSKHVLLELERLHKGQEDLKKQVSEVISDLRLLKFQAAMWGSGAGIIITIIVQFVISHI